MAELIFRRGEVYWVNIEDEEERNREIIKKNEKAQKPKKADLA